MVVIGVLLFDALLDVHSEPLPQHLRFEHLYYGRAILGVDRQHLAHQLPQPLGIITGQGRIVPFEHLHSQSIERLRIKSMPETTHLIDDATQRPDVRLVRIGLVFELLGGHVVGRADDCAGQLDCGVEDLADAEVPQTNSAIR